jgi:hypothetical protein
MLNKVIKLSIPSCLLLLGSVLYSNEPVLSSYGTLGYAYMKGGTKLVKVIPNSAEYAVKALIEEDKNNDIELIKITRGGYYPNYSMNSNTENGKGGKGMPTCLVHMNDKDPNLPFCRSHYTSREALMTGVATLWNAAATFTTVGLNVATGTLADPKYFHKDEFLDIVKKADLPKYREALLSLNTYSDDKVESINRMYEKAYSEYSDNQKLLTVTYTLQDKSGFYNQNTIDGAYSIALNAPQKKNYEYLSLINNEVFAEGNQNLEEQVKAIKEKIDEKYKNDVQEYEKYLSSNFKNYKLVGNSSKTFKHNDKISFYATIKAPTQEIPYTLGKKITINIPVTIEYADIKGMVPKEYALQDTNFNMLMRADSGLGINGIMSNKTQSFITVKSLTSYYQNLVFNVSNLDKELAPEAKDLDDGTRYSLITSSMSEKSNFEKITKSKAQAIKINYGYAVKYKVNDTNIEKAIYNTKNYSLYEIIQQYLK